MVSYFNTLLDQKNFMKNQCRFSIFLFLCILLFSVQGYSMELRADRTEVSLNDTFTMTLKSSTGDSLNQVNLSPIQQHFHIVGKSFQSGASFVNGKAQRSNSIVLKVIPKAKGRVTIKPIKYKNLVSNSLSINILDAAISTVPLKNKALWVEAEIDKKNALPEEQLIYTLRIYIGTSLHNANLSPFEIPQAKVTPLPDHQFQRIIDSKQYNIIEKKFALQFSKTGDYIIPAQTLEALTTRSRSSYVKLNSKEISISINDFPANANLTPWLPASELNLSDEWSLTSNTVNIGDPITRKITLSVNGLSAEALPAVYNENVKGFNIYPEKPQFDNEVYAKGIAGTRVETLAIIPNQEGDITLPAIELEWWNTRTGKTEIARLPSRTLTVKNLATANVTQQSDPSLSIPNLSNNSKTTLTDDDNVTAPLDSEPANNKAISFWRNIALFSLLIWSASLVMGFIFFQRYKNKTQPANPENSKIDNINNNLKIQLKQLLASCKKGSAKQAKHDLYQWAVLFATDLANEDANQTNNLNNSYSKNKLSTHRAIEIIKNDELQEAINQLNAHLYNVEGSDWNGESLAKAVNNIAHNKTRKANNKPSTLKPLYPV